MRKEDVYKLIAPRPLLGVRETARKSQLDDFQQELTKLWSLIDAPDNFEFVQVVNGKHEFYVAQTIDFFKRHL